MKYSDSNRPLVCMQTNSTCYKQTRKMEIKGVLWHSTGANNRYIQRYVQPSDNDANRAQLLKLIGRNQYGNDWNHIDMEAGLNAWIGLLDDDVTVAAVQTMPWDYRPWGCGSGSRGSCNNGFIQFEICEDNLTDPTYFEKVYKEACELTAYLCKMYSIDPYGKTTVNGVTNVPTILCHIDSYNLGLGSGHSDVLHWFPKFGKNMDTVRDDVAALMKGANGITPVKDPAPAPSSGSSMLREGSSDKVAVKALQEKLIKLGYNIYGGADGIFGSYTTQAVKKFQSEYNVYPVDGVVGPITMSALDKALADKEAASKMLRVGSSGSEVKVLQEKLIKLGYSIYGGADGSYGSYTKNTVIKFQQEHNVSPVDGVAGPITMKAIEEALKKQSAPAPVVTPVKSNIYRVRKSWADTKSQLGAFKSLDNAVAAAKNGGSAYAVFAEDGTQVYPTAASQAPTPTATVNYRVKVTASVLNVRKDATTNSAVTTQIHRGEVYTIVGEKGEWLKLKSGAGYINKNYVTKL